ncbi:MAG: hypothetical protein AAF772_19600 [Acidobacteriota bacterium]
MFEADPPRRYRLASGYVGRLSNLIEFDTQVAIASDGLRQQPAAAPASARALMLGDSFVFGWGVAEGQDVASLLDAQLPSLRLRNAGTPGFGPPDQVAWLEAHGLTRPLELLILAPYLGNDLLDATASYGDNRIVDGLVGDLAPPDGMLPKLDRASHLLRFLKRRVSLDQHLALRRRLGLPAPASMIHHVDFLRGHALAPNALIVEGRRNTRQAMRRLKTLSERFGFSVMVVLIPHRAQVNRSMWRYVFRQVALDPSGYDPTVPERFFSAVAEEHGFPVLNLAPIFRRHRARRDGRLYFRYDEHWTPRGHALAASHILPFVRRAWPPGPVRVEARADARPAWNRGPL